MNIYIKTTGKSKEEIENIMNRNNGKGEWITPDEAKEIGFVTDVFEPKKMVAFFSSEILSQFHLPAIPNNIIIPTIENQAEPTWLQKIFNRLDVMSGKVETAITNTKTLNMNKDFKLINLVLGIEGLESTDGKNFNLTIENLQAINARLEALEKLQNEAQQSKTDLTNAIDLIDGIHTTVKEAAGIQNKVGAITKILTEKPGQGAAQNLGKDKNTTGVVNQEIIDSLEHNREADANL
jgi:hypothetical protein